jgi:ubiquinone/menaquinone biosynthesis C-methylase UbiE
MLERILEPEVMDSPAEAVDYNAMDHSEVNRQFVADLLAARADLGDTLDLGTGTALIPIELCQVAAHARITGVDAAAHMLQVGQQNIARVGLTDRIELALVDAKRLPYSEGRFSAVLSNSIVHHIPEPIVVLREAVRVCTSGGLLFFRDLLRPHDETTLRGLVETYAIGANDHQRQMFADSLHAALTIEEIRNLVATLGFARETVQATSDRHWTWIAKGSGVGFAATTFGER